MKINIENYESMTAEEKVAALEAYEPDMSGFVSKAAFDKTSSELAATKKQLKERMTDDEAKAAKEAEERAAKDAKLQEMAERLEELETERAVNSYVTSYLAMGYDEKLAKSSASALAKGDMETVFKNQKIHAENSEKALKAELLKHTPPPAAGGAEGAMKKEDFSKLSLAEKQKFATENPEEYASFYEK